IVEEVVAAGITDITVVIGRGKTAIQDHFDHNIELEHALEASGKTADLERVRALADMADIHYIRQGTPKGPGHAVSVTRSHIGDEPFALLFEDDLYLDASHLSNMLDMYARLRSSIVAVKQVTAEEVSLYGCIEPADVNGDLAIGSIVEKPSPEEAPSK